MADYMAQIEKERVVTQKLKKEIRSFEVANSTSSTNLENKYLAEIHTLTTNFGLYKREAQQNILALKTENTQLDAVKKMKEDLATRLKQEKRSLIQNHESNQRMHKDKIEKLQGELVAKVDEVKKLKCRIANLKTKVTSFERLDKKPL